MATEFDKKTVAVAPMMDWTDRHCRYFHRVLTKRALLYSEMVVADAIIHGDRDYLLGGCGDVDNVALQLGGSDPEKLAQAAQIGEQYGYNEINLNVGCPSDRVKSGTFGACLMREPELVGRCVEAMKNSVDIRVTVKCRIGVDDQDTGPALDDLANAVWNSGCDRLWVHARKAWLEGLSPKENREIPPLDYGRVERLKSENMNHFIGINGGVDSLIQCSGYLKKFDGAMMGRAAYHSPAQLREVDRELFGDEIAPVTYDQVCDAMQNYAERHLATGGRLNQITRHMLGLFHGLPGARRYRQIMSVEATKPGAGPDVIREALDAVQLVEAI